MRKKPKGRRAGSGEPMGINRVSKGMQTYNPKPQETSRQKREGKELRPIDASQIDEVRFERVPIVDDRVWRERMWKRSPSLTETGKEEALSRD